MRVASVAWDHNRVAYTPTLLLEEGDAHEQHLRLPVLTSALREVAGKMPAVLLCGLVAMALVLWVVVAALVRTFDGHYD